jgi:epoxyqueuosine reductase QueG
MGIHLSLIHPKYGSFVLLGTVLIAADVEVEATALNFSPCSKVEALVDMSMYLGHLVPTFLMMDERSIP